MSLFHRFTEIFNNQEDTQVLESQCKHVDSTGECGLIQRLKELQAKKKEIDTKISLYDKNNTVVVDNFIMLLDRMESHRFEMGCEYSSRYMPGVRGSRIRKTFNDFDGVARFCRVIDKTTEEEIDKIYEELKAIKHREIILYELREQSSKLEAEIKEIKDTLGIE